MTRPDERANVLKHARNLEMARSAHANVRGSTVTFYAWLDRLLPARLLGRGVILRELMPQELKIEVAGLKPDQAMALAEYLAVLVGHAHGRQMSPELREQWQVEIGNSFESRLDAPSRLWSSVVELLAVHEAAYLHHCRRFAPSEAA